MLAVTRRTNESLVMETSDGPITFTITSIKGNQTKMSIDAPQSVKILRKELLERRGASCQQGIATQAENNYS